MSYLIYRKWFFLWFSPMNSFNQPDYWMLILGESGTESGYHFFIISGEKSMRSFFLKLQLTPPPLSFEVKEIFRCSISGRLFLLKVLFIKDFKREREKNTSHGASEKKAGNEGIDPIHSDYARKMRFYYCDCCLLWSFQLILGRFFLNTNSCEWSLFVRAFSLSLSSLFCQLGILEISVTSSEAIFRLVVHFCCFEKKRGGRKSVHLPSWHCSVVYRVRRQGWRFVLYSVTCCAV